MSAMQPGRSGIGRSRRKAICAAAGVLLGFAAFDEGRTQPGSGVRKGDREAAGSVSRSQAVEVAPVGAGTTNGATTGTSHPRQPTSSTQGLPPLPNPSLCKQYQGEVQEQCLQTVLRGLVVDRRKGVSP